MEIKRSISAPRTWRNPRDHFYTVLDDPWYSLNLRLSSLLFDATQTFYRARNIISTNVPVTGGSISSPMGLGSDSEPVKINLFGREIYLVDSMQFALEYLLRINPGGVYYVAPAFRGEVPDESHLNQFFHSEAEIVGTLTDVQQLVEDYVLHLVDAVLDSALVNDLEYASGTLTHLKRFASQREIPCVTFAEARNLLSDVEDAFKETDTDHPGITRVGELALMEKMGGWTWISRPPTKSVPFYQASTLDGSEALSADLLIGIGEVVGCGQRHADGRAVARALEDHHVSVEEYKWYVELKNVRPMQTAGFGLGLERLMLWILNHDDIRDIALLPRIAGHDNWV